MRKVAQASGSGVFAFAIESGLNPNPNPMRLVQALRRAVMARTRDVLGAPQIPLYFSGHREDGAPAGADEHHLVFTCNPIDGHLLILAPDLLDRRNPSRDVKNLAILESALRNFRELRAGVDGHLQLRPVFAETACRRLFQTSHVWESVTPYEVNRHLRKSTAGSVLKNDIVIECERRGLPLPDVTIMGWTAVPNSGLQGRLRLQFQSAITGPVILGKSRYMGGGLFAQGDQPVLPSDGKGDQCAAIITVASSPQAKPDDARSDSE